MNGQDALDYAEIKGMEDGALGAPYSPPFVPGYFPDGDDAYNVAYWDSFAYEGITR